MSRIRIVSAAFFALALLFGATIGRVHAAPKRDQGVEAPKSPPAATADARIGMQLPANWKLDPASEPPSRVYYLDDTTGTGRPKVTGWFGPMNDGDVAAFSSKIVAGMEKGGLVVAGRLLSQDGLLAFIRLKAPDGTFVVLGVRGFTERPGAALVFVGEWGPENAVRWASQMNAVLISVKIVE